MKTTIARFITTAGLLVTVAVLGTPGVGRAGPARTGREACTQGIDGHTRRHVIVGTRVQGEARLQPLARHGGTHTPT